jgi:SNF2 family DNA or RNA helicase
MKEQKPETLSLLIKENVDDETFVAEDLGDGELAESYRRPPGLSEDFELMPHQQIGCRWLEGHTLLAQNASDHGMLADDMGLGKTLQVLAVMSRLKEQSQLRPCLLVAPVSLLQNWQAESARFFPGRFSMMDIRGKSIAGLDLTGFDVVLASYATVRTKQLELGLVQWKLMVLDESHEIRTPSAQQTKAMLAMKSERRIALTGTPVQNSLVDLWSQFDWLAPGLLGSLREFKKRYQSKAIVDDQLREERLEELREKLGKRWLRRLKSQLKSVKLPPKVVRREFLVMSAAQEALYDSVLRDFAKQASPLKTLHQLQRACAEPNVLTLDDSIPNTKLEWLLVSLEQVAQDGEKAVVFAEWYSLQDAIMRAVEAKFGVTVDRINGKVDAGSRQMRIDRFNRAHGFGVMVLGPKAAGVGLTITGANHVYHLTRPWNPATEAQATDRVYRIGQTRPVTVHLPIMKRKDGKETLEQHLDKLLAFRAGLAEDLLTPIESLDLGRELKRCVLEEEL